MCDRNNTGTTGRGSVERYYTASKSRTQGREGWAVIFRHPVRTDATTGKSGRRIRRGLGTGDETEADRLVTQLNELLSTPSYWEPSARETARARFDARVVTIFYDGMASGDTDFEAVREAVLPLPGASEGYRRV